MFSTKVSFAVCVGVALCAAQPINIQGTVKDRAGVNSIPGATVMLENGKLVTTTGADGSFSLYGTAAVWPAKGAAPKQRPVIHRGNGTVEISLAGNTGVALSAFDIRGRLVFYRKKTFAAGTHILPLPAKTSGLRLYRITIGHDVYTFKSLLFVSSSHASDAAADLTGPESSSRWTATAAPMRDILLVTKQGLLDYRDSMRTTDTSGMEIRMIPNAGNATDIEGNVYQAVQIGSQVWTIENLRTTKYNDGTAIPLVTSPTEWQALSTPGYCFYNNNTDPSQREKWGVLYNWYAVNTGKLAPAGWHVPSAAEWSTLENYLIANGYNWDGTTSGNKIGKSMAAKTDWTGYSTIGTIGNDPSSNNRSGLSALPGGYRHYSGSFFYGSYHGYWWSTKESDASNAMGYFLYYRSEGILGYDSRKECGYSVRLIRD